MHSTKNTDNIFELVLFKFINIEAAINRTRTDNQKSLQYQLYTSFYHIEKYLFSCFELEKKIRYRYTVPLT